MTLEEEEYFRFASKCSFHTSIFGELYLCGRILHEIKPRERCFLRMIVKNANNFCKERFTEDLLNLDFLTILNSYVETLDQYTRKELCSEREEVYKDSGLSCWMKIRLFLPMGAFVLAEKHSLNCLIDVDSGKAFQIRTFTTLQAPKNPAAEVRVVMKSSEV